ncbi:MAG: ATP-binding protein [Myxococcales bacterium]|nr:ATP-binding protein [Myxococcales bacterium]
MSHVVRTDHARQVRELLEEFPVVGLLGPRQVGKTTLARDIASERAAAWFDLELPRDAVRLADPGLALEGLEGLVVIDEVQRQPELFPLLRVLVDRPDHDLRFLVLGSASPELLRQGSETLAGRIAFHVLDGFDLDEVPDWRTLWGRGGFPRSFLAGSDAASLRWREAFVDTFLSRDLPALGIAVPPTTMRRFWTMLAHWHGQRWNGAELGRAFGMSDTTVRRYLDLLEAAYAVTVLQPWHENLGKRQVRAPKVYVRDSGLLHALLGVADDDDLQGRPLVGASWEGFALGQVVRRLRARPHECYHWATHQGTELDLLVVRGQQRLGFEFKRTSTPQATRSMHIARDDLGLDRVDVVWPGAGTWPLGDRIRAVGIEDLGALSP